MLIDIRSVLAANGLTVVAGDQAIRVLQQRPGRVVARADTTHGPVVLKASADEGGFVTEETAIRVLAGHGLPVARVICHASGPPSYLILSWIEGAPLSSANPPRAQRAAGELLRQVHALGSDPGHGRPAFPDGTTWEAWMAGWLNSALTWWATVDPTWWSVADPGSDERHRRAWAWFRDLAPLLATRGGDLILFDGRPEHILTRGDEIAGLIDVAQLRTGDAAMDLGVLAACDPGVLDGVRSGYRPRGLESHAFERLIPFYTLLRAISLAQWHQRFGTPAELEHALTRVASIDIPT